MVCLFSMFIFRVFFRISKCDTDHLSSNVFGFCDKNVLERYH